LLPELDRYCELHSIPRVQVDPIKPADKNDKFVHFAHYIAHDVELIAEIGIVQIARAIHASNLALNGEDPKKFLAKAWYVKDVDTLYLAVKIPGSYFRNVMLSHLRTF
jgi:hypothetical protein